MKSDVEMPFRLAAVMLAASALWLASCSAPRAATVELHLVTACKPSDRPLVLESTGETLCLMQDIIANTADIHSTSLDSDPNDSETAVVQISFSPQAAQRLRTFTTAHLHGRIGITLDSQLISAPTIVEPVSNLVAITFQLSNMTAKQMTDMKTLATVKP